MRQVFVLGVILFLAFLGIGRVWAYTSPGQPTGYVNDFAGVLSTETKDAINSRLSSLDASTSAQVTVVTVKTLGDETVESYAEKLFAEWGIGQKGKDNGVLMLFAMDERKMRIEVGYGLEGALTDAETSEIIRNVITPAFKEGNYDQGVAEGVEAVLIAASEDLIPIRAEMSSSFSMDQVWPVAIMLFMFMEFIGSIMARSKSWWLGGVIGGIIGLVVTFTAGFVMAGLTTMVILVPVGLLFDYLVSKQYQKSKTTGSYPWWIGGSSGFGGGRSSGGGFGGFGGGRSGGGGSSGSW